MKYQILRTNIKTELRIEINWDSSHFDVVTYSARLT